MINLVITPSNASAEITFSEYEPHFNYIIKNTHTPTYIATKYPEFFYYKDKTIFLDTLKTTRRTLSSITDVAIKDINVINFPKALISPDTKIYKKVFTVTKRTPLIIPDFTSLVKCLDKLKIASKIVTYQEIFTYFAMIYEIPCLTFVTNWNANTYKNSPWIKLIQGDIKNKEIVIEKFLAL